MACRWILVSLLLGGFVQPLDGQISPPRPRRPPVASELPAEEPVRPTEDSPLDVGGKPKAIDIVFKSDGGKLFRGGLYVEEGASFELRPLSLEGYEGASHAWEVQGRLKNRHGEPGPNVHVAIYVAANGMSWSEISVGSEAVFHCMPNMRGVLELKVGDRYLHRGWVDCPDQTGLAFRLGNPFPIQLTKVVESLERRLPVYTVPNDVIRRWASREDPDPFWNTHQTGSPRNSYWALDSLYYLRSRDPLCLVHLSDFVLSQYGFINAEGKYLVGRPYHLTQQDGRPWRTGHHYRVDEGSLRPAEMLEGRPLIFSKGADTLGRKKHWPKGLPEVLRNGYDHEHMEVERLFAAAILMRSERARRDLLHLGEALWSQNWGIYHSSRTLGWNLRLYLRLYQVFGRTIDRDRLDEILTKAWNLRDWEGKSPLPSLLTRSRGKGGVKGHTQEATWQAATAGAASWEIYAWVREEDEDLAKKARRLLLHSAEIMCLGWRPQEGGMIDSYDIFTETKAGSGIPSKYIPPSMLGVAMWTVAPLAFAFEVTGDRRYETPARALALNAARTRVSGRIVNGVRSWNLGYFIDANRILGIPTR